MAFFTRQEIEHFKEHGFVRKPNVVDRELLTRAADRFYDEIGLDRNDPQSFINAAPQGNLKVTSHPDIRATLTDSPLQKMCEELVGHELEVHNHTFAKPVFPTGRPQSEWAHPAHGHLDGYARPGVVHSFTIAVTVNVNDVQPRSGAFTVWPGTHRHAYEYFRTHPLLDGLKAFQDRHGNFVDLPEPVENPGPAGSTVFWHHLLMHAAGNHHGTEVRMACVSRFARTDLDRIKSDVPEDMWKHWAI